MESSEQMDRLTSIIAFMRAADAGTFAGAAAAIGVNGSAVSKSVGRLESHLGVRLFQRTTRALTLTDDGRAYYERCARVLADLDEAEAAMSQRSQSLRGRLAVDLPVALGRLYVAPALTDFLRSHPELELVATLNNRFVDLVGEGYDAVVRIGDVGDFESGRTTARRRARGGLCFSRLSGRDGDAGAPEGSRASPLHHFRGRTQRASMAMAVRG